MLELIKDFLRTGTPSSTTWSWNGGSFLGLMFLMQTLSGWALATRYVPDTKAAYFSVMYTENVVSGGWAVRLFHVVGANSLMVGMALHAGRTLLFGFIRRPSIWASGFLLFSLTAASAFFGYVLPWGNMSFWAATVITSLVGTVPSGGHFLVEWLWGGASLSTPTLTRFFSLHFLLPLLAWVAILFHILLLHQEGSSSTTKFFSGAIPLTPGPLWRDLTCWTSMILLGCFMSSHFLYLLEHPENWRLADPLSTPSHITPDWYFLVPYAILRSIPHREGGVIALILVILSPLIMFFPSVSDSSWKGPPYLTFWSWMLVLSTLSFVGARPAVEPYLTGGRLLAPFYFLFCAKLSWAGR